MNIFLFDHRRWKVCHLVLKHYTTWNVEHAHTSHHDFELSKSGCQTNPVFECTRRPLTIQFTVYQGLRADLIIWCVFPVNTGWLNDFESVKLVLISNLNKLPPGIITETFTFVLNPYIPTSIVSRLKILFNISLQLLWGFSNVLTKAGLPNMKTVLLKHKASNIFPFMLCVSKILSVNV